jgi:hypothetical protein
MKSCLMTYGHYRQARSIFPFPWISFPYLLLLYMQRQRRGQGWVRRGKHVRGVCGGARGADLIGGVAGVGLSSYVIYSI